MKNSRDLKDRAQALMAAGRYRRAASLWAELIGADPADSYARLRHAEASRRAGDIPAAVASYRAAAEILERRQQWSAAHAALRVALEIAPSDPETSARLARIEQHRRGAAPEAAQGSGAPR